MNERNPKPDPRQVQQIQKIPRKMGPFMIFIFKEILRQKRWLLLPVWVLFAAIGIFILLGGGSAILPSIYIVL